MVDADTTAPGRSDGWRTAVLWCAAVLSMVAVAVSSAPYGDPVRVGATRPVVVTGGTTGPWTDPATTPWVALGVSEHQPVLFDTIGGVHLPRTIHRRGTAGPAAGEIADSVEEARRHAERILGARPVAEVHLGAGTGRSVGLIAALALVGSSGAADPAGCGRPEGCLRVAATGALTADVAGNGLVWGIGGLPEKLTAARDAGVDVVFHPAENLPDPDVVPFADPGWFRRAGDSWAGGQAVVPVWTITDALAWLCGAAGDEGTCELAGFPGT